MAAAKGLPIPAPDEVPTEDLPGPFAKNDSHSVIPDHNIKSLTVPISSRSQSYNSDSSSNLSPFHPTFPLPSTPNSGAALLRGRAKTLASLTSSSKNTPQPEMMPREMHLPKDPYINGQPIGAYLYKDAVECPICFLYYPPYLNRTRCCDQSICSECFVQIKRPDPHQPEHADPTAPPTPCPPSSELPGVGEADSDPVLVSEPAACPFCVQPEFGITYEPPSFRRGLTYVSQASAHPVANITSAMSSNSSLASFRSNGGQASPTTAGRRRTTSISANASTVITTDRVRPDWASKLSSARAHAARRSAAATALHTAAYLMGNRNQSPDARSFGGFGRRGMLRRGTGADSPSGGTSSAHLNMLALMSERYAASAGDRRNTANSGESSPTITGPPRESSRRNRVEDLEDMMMMEAIRLSLASEEDRRKREEKESKKEAKKKVKEEKKAEKVARKTGAHQSQMDNSSKPFESSQDVSLQSNSGKAKSSAKAGIENVSDSELTSPLRRPTPTEGLAGVPQTHFEQGRAQLQSSDGLHASSLGGISPYKPSHLRTLSNASSSASSITEAVSGYHGSHSSLDISSNASGINISHGDSPGGGASPEPMFNFRSLAAMIDDDDKSDVGAVSEHAEHIDKATDHYDQAESSNNVLPHGEGKESGSLEKGFATLKSKGDVGTVSTGNDIRAVTSPSAGVEAGFKDGEIEVTSFEDGQRGRGRV